MVWYMVYIVCTALPDKVDAGLFKSATLVAGEHIYLNDPPKTNTTNTINTNITEEGGGSREVLC